MFRSKSHFIPLSRRMIESDIHHPLLFSQPEQTDSISLTQSEPCVSFPIVQILPIEPVAMFLLLFV